MLRIFMRVVTVISAAAVIGPHVAKKFTWNRRKRVQEQRETEDSENPPEGS